MKREIGKLEKHCDSLIQGLYETLVFPTLIKAAKKAGLRKIEEMNNYYFFTTTKNEEFIDREFIEASDKNRVFYEKYMRPLDNARYMFPKNLKLIF